MLFALLASSVGLSTISSHYQSQEIKKIRLDVSKNTTIIQGLAKSNLKLLNVSEGYASDIAQLEEFLGLLSQNQELLKEFLKSLKDDVVANHAHDNSVAREGRKGSI